MSLPANVQHAIITAEEAGCVVIEPRQLAALRELIAAAVSPSDPDEIGRGYARVTGYVQAIIGDDL